MQKTDAPELPGDETYEQQFIDYLNSRAPEGVSAEEAIDALKLSPKQFWAAVRGVCDRKKLVFRFKVDDVDHFTTWENRKQAFVEQRFPMSREMAALYAAFGTGVPKTIERTPTIVPIADGDGDDLIGDPYYNRYLDDDDITDDEGERLCENLRARRGE